MSGELVAINFYDHEHGAIAGKSRLEALGIDAFIVIENNEKNDHISLESEEYGVYTRIEDAVVAREILGENVDDSELFPGNEL